MTEIHRPGQWPAPRTPLPEPEPEHESPNAVRARFEMVLGSIKYDLAQQPSERCIRAAARRWTGAITAATNEAVQRLRHPE